MGRDRRAAPKRSLLDKPGGIFVRRSEQMSEEDKVLHADGRARDRQRHRGHARRADRAPRRAPSCRVAALRRRARAAPRRRRRSRRERSSAATWSSFNGLGGFTPRRPRVRHHHRPREPRTPAPWVNVLANPQFGTRRQRERRRLHLVRERARATGSRRGTTTRSATRAARRSTCATRRPAAFWSPDAAAGAAGRRRTRRRHGFGYSIFEHTEDGIATRAADLRRDRRAGQVRRAQAAQPLRAAAAAVGHRLLRAGARRDRPANLPHVVTEVDPKTGALFARNAYNSEFARPRRVPRLQRGAAHGHRRPHRVPRPQRHARPTRRAWRRTRLSGRVGAGLDPCVAMQVTVELADGQEREIAFTFGSGRDLADARHLVDRFRGTGPARAALEELGAIAGDACAAASLTSRKATRRRIRCCRRCARTAPPVFGSISVTTCSGLRAHVSPSTHSKSPVADSRRGRPIVAQLAAPRT